MNLSVGKVSVATWIEMISLFQKKAQITRRTFLSPSKVIYFIDKIPQVCTATWINPKTQGVLKLANFGSNSQTAQISLSL